MTLKAGVQIPQHGSWFPLFCTNSMGSVSIAFFSFIPFLAHCIHVRVLPATIDPPVFSVANATTLGRGPFVLVAVDSAVPTLQQPTSAQVLHLIAPDFYFCSCFFGLPGLTGISSLKNNTPAISEWLQPVSPARSPPHRCVYLYRNPSVNNDYEYRYIFWLFKQPVDFVKQARELINSTSIQNWNISSFARETGLGSPLAGTFMLVAADSTST
jgi:phosphatidylethanolamine-binding protein